MPDPTPAAAATQEEPKVITQDALLKSLQDVEKLAKGETVEDPAAEPTVETTAAPKPAAEVIEEGASEELKKGLNASPLLKEIVTGLGNHLDTVIGDLRKSVDGQLQRDAAIVGTLETLTKSIGTIAEKVETIGKEPAAPAGARPVTATTEQVLEKSGAEPGADKTDPDPVKRAAQAKKIVLGGLEKLVKSATDPNEQKRFTNALIKFESTGSIDEVMLMEAHNAMAPAAAPAK